MIFHSTQIKGHNRGHAIGFPTINLVVPTDRVLDEGVYAVWVVIHGITYKGAFHYGSIPTFGQKEISMEVYLLDITDETVPDTQGVPIEIDIVEYLRPVAFFANTDDLMNQITRDVERVRMLLS